MKQEPEEVCLPILVPEPGEEVAVNERRPDPAAKRAGAVRTGQGRGLVGLCVAVAIFAAAFLLCEGGRRFRVEESVRGMGGMEGAFQVLEENYCRLLRRSFLGETQKTEDDSADESSVLANEEPQPAGYPVQVVTGAVTTEQSQEPAREAAELSRGLTRQQLYDYDRTAVPEGMIPIVPMDMSLTGYGEGFHYNDTDYTLTIAPPESGEAGNVIPAMAGVSSEDVLVLVYHTHATEGFSPESSTYYDPSGELARSEDPTKSVIAVGAALCRALEAKGIRTLHDTTLHDLASYRDSYSRAAETVKRYLKEYPSLVLAIDVHRDSIMTTDDRLIRPVTVVDGEAVAQIMCVVGSDAAGTYYPRWRQSLGLAVALRHELNERYETLCRPVYVKRSSYNQQYAPASLLLEIGASGNSLSEALRTAVLVGDTLADMLS